MQLSIENTDDTCFSSAQFVSRRDVPWFRHDQTNSLARENTPLDRVFGVTYLANPEIATNENSDYNAKLIVLMLKHFESLVACSNGKNSTELVTNETLHLLEESHNFAEPPPWRLGQIRHEYDRQRFNGWVIFKDVLYSKGAIRTKYHSENVLFVGNLDYFKGPFCSSEDLNSIIKCRNILDTILDDIISTRNKAFHFVSEKDKSK